MQLELKNYTIQYMLGKPEKYELQINKNNVTELILRSVKEKFPKIPQEAVTILRNGRAIYVFPKRLIDGSAVVQKIIGPNFQEKSQAIMKIKNEKDFDIFINCLFVDDPSFLLTHETAFDLLSFAHEYGLGGLENRCTKFLCDNINSKNVYGMLAAANMYNLEWLKRACNEFFTQCEKSSML